MWFVTRTIAGEKEPFEMVIFQTKDDRIFTEFEINDK